MKNKTYFEVLLHQHQHHLHPPKFSKQFESNLWWFTNLEILRTRNKNHFPSLNCHQLASSEFSCLPHLPKKKENKLCFAWSLFPPTPLSSPNSAKSSLYYSFRSKLYFYVTKLYAAREDNLDWWKQDHSIMIQVPSFFHVCCNVTIIANEEELAVFCWNNKVLWMLLFLQDLLPNQHANVWNLKMKYNNY